MGGNLGAVRSLLAHPAFAMSNPNMCYSMFLSFLRSTPTFHAADGSGYEFLADSILQARADRAPTCPLLACSAATPALAMGSNAWSRLITYTEQCGACVQLNALPSPVVLERSCMSALSS